MTFCCRAARIIGMSLHSEVLYLCPPTHLVFLKDPQADDLGAETVSPVLHVTRVCHMA